MFRRDRKVNSVSIILHKDGRPALTEGDCTSPMHLMDELEFL